jgi:DNA-binding response OmpR family regulator
VPSVQETTTLRGAHEHVRSPARVLLVSDQPVLAEVVTLALNHGRFHSDVVSTAQDAMVILGQRRPQLAIVDMDLAQGQMLDQLGYTAAGTGAAARIPVVALTRRGDLKTTLAAFARGVDDILTVPFPPEELVARVLAVMRRTYGAEVAFTP